MLEGPLPDVATGPHCTAPYECPFFARCHGPAPEHAIEDLHRISATKLSELHDDGVETVDQIPPNFPLNGIQERHRAAVLRNELILEPGLQGALAAYRYPIAMLDFETINPALPIWNGCSPFGKVPVQFSVHVLGEDGQVSKHAYLADGNGDPRPAVARALSTALNAAATVLAWNAQFEKDCLRILAEACPEHAATLLDARDRTQDLLLLVRNHVYHPEFRGSFSIKDVVPALLPEMAYESLEVSDGQVAAFLLERMLCRPEQLEVGEGDALRTQLCAYCEHDTAVMVALFRFLQRAAAGSA